MNIRRANAILTAAVWAAWAIVAGMMLAAR